MHVRGGCYIFNDMAHDPANFASAQEAVEEIHQGIQAATAAGMASVKIAPTWSRTAGEAAK
jgi:hypothetical protein